MSRVPTTLKSDRLVFERCFPAETMEKQSSSSVTRKRPNLSWNPKRLDVINTPVHEILIPIASASSQGYDEIAFLYAIADSY